MDISVNHSKTIVKHINLSIFSIPSNPVNTLGLHTLQVVKVAKHLRFSLNYRF